LANDTGTAGDKITSDPRLTGTGDVNAVVQFTVDGAAISGTATAGGNGGWTFTPTGLADGSHTVEVGEAELGGNTGTATLTFTLDTVAPAMTESLANDTGTAGDNLTNDPTLTGSGDPNAVVQFMVDGAAISGTATAGSDGVWRFTPTGLADGSHRV